MRANNAGCSCELHGCWVLILYACSEIWVSDFCAGCGIVNVLFLMAFKVKVGANFAVLKTWSLGVIMISNISAALPGTRFENGRPT